ncbi:uncharacterized protein LOC144877129 [Branchiostoma floridae x Branchiostoma japonicum]
MTASAVAGLPPLRLTVLVLCTTFGAVQQTACMPVQTLPSPTHGDGMVPPWYPTTQPTTMDSTTKVPEVDQDPATTMPPSSEVKLGTTSVRLTATTQTIPGSSTQDGVHSTSMRQTTALLSTTGTDEVKVTTEATEGHKNATTPGTPTTTSMEDPTEQGGDVTMKTPASKGTDEDSSDSEVIKVDESGDGRSAIQGWQGDDSSVFERATTEQPQMPDKMGRIAESYQASTTITPAKTTQQTETKPATPTPHTTSTSKQDLTSVEMKMNTTGKPTESTQQEDGTSSDPKTDQTSKMANPTTVDSLSTTVESTTTQSQSTRPDTTTTRSPSTKVDPKTTQPPSTTADSTSLQPTQVTSRAGQSSKGQSTDPPRQQRVSVGSQTSVVEITTLRPTEEVTQKQKDDILQPALPAHTDEREAVATMGTNQELPEGWQRDGSSVQGGGRNVEETGKSSGTEDTTNRNKPAVLTTEPASSQTTQMIPTSARASLDKKLVPVQPTEEVLASTSRENAEPVNIQEDKSHQQTTTAIPAEAEVSTQKKESTTPQLEQMIEMENNQGTTQRPDNNLQTTNSQTTVSVMEEDRISTQKLDEMEQKLTTLQPTVAAKDEHPLTTTFSVLSTPTVTQRPQKENLQTEPQQTRLNNDMGSPTTTLPADAENIMTTSTAKATTELKPTDVPRYLEAEVFGPEEVTVQETQDKDQDKDEQPTVSSSQEGGDASWLEHVEVMEPADVLCEEVPDGMVELPLLADGSVSGLHMEASAEYDYQSSGDTSVQSESEEILEESTEDTGGQSSMEETTMATTAGLSDDAFERILSGDFLQDEGEDVEAMSLFTGSEAEQKNEGKQSKQEDGSKVHQELPEKPSQVLVLVTASSNEDREATIPVTQSSNQERETTEYVTEPTNQGGKTTVPATQSSNQKRETTEYVTESTNQNEETTRSVTEPTIQDSSTTKPATEPANQGRETTEYVTEPTNQGRGTTEPITEPSNQDRETTEYVTEPTNQGRGTTEPITEPSNQDRETTEYVTEPTNQNKETTEPITKPSTKDRDTTAVYKPPTVVPCGLGQCGPLLADEHGEDILPTDLIVSSKDGKGAESDKKDTILTNLQETTTQTTTGVATTDARMDTELTTVVPSMETTVPTNTLPTKEEKQKVTSFVSTMPVSTTTTVPETTSDSRARTTETGKTVERTTTETAYPTSSIGETNKALMETTEKPVTDFATDRLTTTPQEETLDLELFTAESDLAAHMIGKITANQEGSKDDSDAVEDEQLSTDAPPPTMEAMFKTDEPDEPKVEPTTVGSKLSSTPSQTTEVDFISTGEPLSEEDGTTVQNTLAVESTEQPKTSEKEAITDTETKAAQAASGVQSTTPMLSTTTNIQDLSMQKTKSSNSETKPSTEMPSSTTTVTMPSPVQNTTADTVVKEVLPTRNAPALRDIVTVKLSKMIEVVTQPTTASTEETKITSKSAPGTSTLYAHMTTVSPTVTSQKSMERTEKPELMATRLMETTTLHATSTEHTTMITQTSPPLKAVQGLVGNDSAEVEDILQVDGFNDTSNQMKELFKNNATTVTVQSTLAASNDKHKETAEMDSSTASQSDVEVTTTLPTTTPLMTQTDSTTMAKTTKESVTDMLTVSTKLSATQKVEEPRRLPAVITVLTARSPVDMPVTTSEPDLSTRARLPESTESTSTPAIIDLISETTVESTTYKTEAEKVEDSGLMTEETFVSEKSTEARTQSTTSTTTEPMKDSTTEVTNSPSPSTTNMVATTAVTEVTTALDYVEILNVDQSASEGETAGSLYLEYPDPEDNAVIHKDGEDVEKETPLDSTADPSLSQTGKMDINTEMMPKSTTFITPRLTEPTSSTVSTVTFGGSDQQDNMPSSTKQHTAEMTTKTAIATTANFISTKQNQAEHTTEGNMKIPSTNISTTGVPPKLSQHDSESARTEHTPPTTRAATATSKTEDTTVTDTKVSATSFPNTSTYADKTQHPLTTSTVLDRESETATRVQEMPSSAKTLPERHLPAIITVLTMRPDTTTPGTTTIQPKEATKKDTSTISTALPATELKNLTAEKVLPTTSGTTTVVPQTTQKMVSTTAMQTTNSNLYRTTTIPQTDVTDTTYDKTSTAGKAAGSLREGQSPDNMATGQSKGKDVSGTTMAPSTAAVTSTTLFQTTEGKMSSTFRTTESSTTQGRLLTTSVSTSGSKHIKVSTDEMTRQIAEITKSPEATTLSNIATTSLFTASTTTEMATTEPSIQTSRSTTTMAPKEMPVRNAAAIITVLTARPPRVQVQTDTTFPQTTSSITTKKASTSIVVPVKETTSERIPVSVMTTEMLETSSSKMKALATTAISRSTLPATKGGPLAVTEKIMLEKDLSTTEATATTSETLIDKETTVTLAHAKDFISTTTGKTTEDKSTLANTETTTASLPEETTTHRAENAEFVRVESAAENKDARTTSQGSENAATNDTVVIKTTTTLATTTTHIEDDMANIDKTVTTSSESTVTTTKESERDAALRKLSNTTEAVKTTTAETTTQPTVRITSTNVMDKRQQDRSTTPVYKTVTTTATPDAETPQDITRKPTLKQEPSEKMTATTTASGIEQTTRGAREVTTRPGAESTSESIQVIDLEEEAKVTELRVDGRVPL